jgi:MATE family, multidrug efflux pump
MQDLTTGSVARHLLKTTSFMLVTMVFQTLYFLIDLYWVGHLGKEAVAAVAIAGNLMFVVLAVTQMLAVGTTTLVSHAAGRKDHPRAHYVFNQSMGLSVVVGLVFFVAATFTRGVYTGNLSADATTAALAEDYLRWFIPAMALQFGITAMSAALRGTGNFKPGMVVQTATVILNMALAPFLIFGWGTGHALGVAGAAISSLVAIVVGTVWMAMYFVAPASYLKFVAADWTPDLSVWRRLLVIGSPAGAEFALMGVYLFIIYAVIRPFGAAAQAGFGIGLRIVQAGFMPVVALGFSVAPVAGQNVGAGLSDRVRDTFRVAAGLAVGVMLVLTVVCHLAPAALIRVFSSDPDVIRVGEEYLRIVSWSFVFSGVIYVSSSMFQALGNTLPALLASVVRLVGVSIPVIMLSRHPGFELRWAWYLGIVSVTLQMAMSLFLLQREFRRRLLTPLTAAPVT